MPEGFDVHVKTASQAIKLLETNQVKFMSLDHDLGLPESENGTGNKVARWIEKMAFHGTLKRIGWAVHSQNPVGRQAMTSTLQNADRFWSRAEKLNTQGDMLEA